MSGGFDWGLRPRGGDEPRRDGSPEEPEAEGPDTDEPDTDEPEDPFAIFSQLEGRSEPEPEPEPDLPPTEAMLTPLNPYRPAQPPGEPPAQPFVFEPPTPPSPVEAEPERSVGIDEIFGESAFREYDDGPLRAQIPFPAPQQRSAEPRPPHAPLTHTQRVLLRVAGGLVAALVLVLVFLLGTHLPGLVPKAEPVASSTPKPVKSASVPVVGPLAPGKHSWDALLGGECVSPYESAWQETYTVVDCIGDHAAQLVSKGVFDDATFPGSEALASRADTLCASSKTLDYAAATAYSDLQVAASYPTTESEWADGYRGYSCFVSRSSADPITGSLAKS